MQLTMREREVMGEENRAGEKIEVSQMHANAVAEKECGDEEIVTNGTARSWGAHGMRCVCWMSAHRIQAASRPREVVGLRKAFDYDQPLAAVEAFDCRCGYYGNSVWDYGCHACDKGVPRG